jgi:hypothetical protein
MWGERASECCCEMEDNERMKGIVGNKKADGYKII